MKTKRIQRGADYANPAGPTKQELERRVVKAAVSHVHHVVHGDGPSCCYIPACQCTECELCRAVAALK